MSTYKQMTLCPDCDLIVHWSELLVSQSAYCPRCGALVHRNGAAFIQKTLAYSLAGLLFYIPAIFLPLITLNILGQSTTNTMLRGIVMLGQSEFWWLSFLVLMCSVVVPFVNLALLFVISLGLQRGWTDDLIRHCLVWQTRIQEWGMLEVYMLGLLVAYSKLVGMGSMVIGMGFYCYIGMLLAGMLAQSVYRAEQAFDYIEALKQQRAKYER